MTPKSSNHNQTFKIALLTFTVSGLLALMLLASFSTNWGVAYGQTAGPTVTPGGQPVEPTPAATTPDTNTNGIASPIIPGLPNTGSGTALVEAHTLQIWQLAAFAGLGLIMLGSALVMVRVKKSIDY